MRNLFLTLTACLALGGIARADEIEDGIGAALKFYKEGKPADAAAALQKVLKQLGDKTGGAVAAALPDKIGNWIAGPVSTHSLGGTGGGSTTSRTYKLDEDKKATISIAADSPLLAQISTFLKAPALGKLLGARPKQVGENMAMYFNKEGLLQFAVDQRYVVVVQGKTLAAEELLEIAAGVNVGVLKSIH